MTMHLWMFAYCGKLTGMMQRNIRWEPSLTNDNRKPDQADHMAHRNGKLENVAGYSACCRNRVRIMLRYEP